MHRVVHATCATRSGHRVSVPSAVPGLALTTLLSTRFSTVVRKPRSTGILSDLSVLVLENEQSPQAAGFTALTIDLLNAYKLHGVRNDGLRSLLASSSPTNCSFCGSHFKGRPTVIAMFVR